MEMKMTTVMKIPNSRGKIAPSMDYYELIRNKKSRVPRESVTKLTQNSSTSCYNCFAS